MDCFKKKSRASEEKEKLVRGAMLLEDVIECCDGKSNPIRFYSADQIIKATNNFSESNQVFSLLFIANPVYKFEYRWYSGKNKNNDMVFIKKLVGTSYRGAHLFCRDIAISSMVSDHKNFLKLVGCCLDFEYPVMVYHGEKKHSQMNLGEEPWKRRMKIAEDIATALAYLHNAFPRPFVYRNMRLGNIILDEDGVAKLCEFSFCVSIPEGETFVDVDVIAGTDTYIEPNYWLYGVVSEKTDVFAIGILMKKLLIGDKRFHELCVDEGGKSEFSGYETKWGKNFSNCFSSSMQERIMEEIADPKMLEMMVEVSEEELCRMKSFLMLSQRCIGLRGEVPTMVEVVKELKKIQTSL